MLCVQGNYEYKHYFDFKFFFEICIRIQRKISVSRMSDSPIALWTNFVHMFTSPPRFSNFSFGILCFGFIHNENVNICTFKPGPGCLKAG